MQSHVVARGARRAGGKRVLVMLASIAVIACGESASSEPVDAYAASAGSYTLTSLNGQPLPALLFQDASVRIDLTSATLVLRANRTFTETLDGQLREGIGQPQPDNQVHNGTYTLSGSTASFTVPAANGFGAFAFSGTLNGNVLTYTDDLATYRYERR